MSPYSSFHPIYIGLFFLCLTVFYLLGECMVSNSWKNPLKIAARFFLGMLLTISGVATFKFGLGSMLFPVFLVMLYLAFNKFYIERCSYEATLPLKALVPIVGIGVVVFYYHAFYGNIVLENAVYIPNTDFSYYAGMGHQLFHFTQESLTVDPQVFLNQNKTFYHYPDLYLSGIISNVFNIIPVYAYSIVGSSILVLIGALMLFSFARIFELSNLRSVLFVTLTLCFAGSLNPFESLSEDVAIFDLFNFSFPAIAAKPYLVMGTMILLAFQLIKMRFNILFSLCLLGLAPLSNPGLALVFPMTFGLLIGLKILFSWLKIDLWSLKVFKYNVLILAFAVACIPYLIYGVLDGRLNTPSDGHVLSELVYLVIHTNIRYYLSLVLLIPALFGLWYWFKQLHSTISILIFCNVVCLGFGFSVAYSLLQGNTIQMFVMGLMFLLIPFLIIGLFKSMDQHPKRWNFWSISLLLLAALTCFNVVSTSLYKGHLDWKYIQSGEPLKAHLYRNTNNQEDLNQIIAATEDKSLIYFSDLVHEEGQNHSTMTHYHDFIFYKGIQPSCKIYPLDLPEDLNGFSKEMTAIVENSTLYNYRKIYGDNYQQKFVDALEADGMICLSEKFEFIPEAYRNKSVRQSNFGKYAIIWFR